MSCLASTFTTTTFFLLLVASMVEPASIGKTNVSSKPVATPEGQSHDLIDIFRPQIGTNDTDIDQIRRIFCTTFKSILVAEARDDQQQALLLVTRAIALRDRYVRAQRQLGMKVPDDPYYGQKELIPVCFPKFEDLIKAKAKELEKRPQPNVAAL